MEVQLIRNATVKIKYGGKNWLVDPFFGDVHSLPSFAGKSANPTTPLPFSTDEILKDVDYIILTHLHPDHFDVKAQESISKEVPFIVQPADAEQIKKLGFKDVFPVSRESFFDDVKVTAVGAQHGDGDILKVMGTVTGYVLQKTGEPSLYITGDTIWYDDIKKTLDKYKPGVVICNAGGNIFMPEHNPFEELVSLKRVHKVIMDEKQLYRLLAYKKDTCVVAVHIGALDHETVTREHLAKYLSGKLIDMKRVFIPEEGDNIIIDHEKER